MQKAMAQKEAVRAAKEVLGEATSEELSAYIREAFGLTIRPFIVGVLIGTGKEREHLDRVNQEVRGRLEGWKAENPEEAKKLAASAKRKEAARRNKAGAPPGPPQDMMPVGEPPADVAKVSA